MLGFLRCIGVKAWSALLKVSMTGIVFVMLVAYFGGLKRLLDTSLIVSGNVLVLASEKCQYLKVFVAGPGLA